MAVIVTVAVAVLATGCNRRRAATPQPEPPVAGVTAPPATPPPRPERVVDALPVPPQPLAEESIADRSLEDLNRESPLKPVFFALDSADLDDAARAVAMANAELLRRYSSWTVTIEGHCDERGTAEYNLALGERRATAVRTYLVSLGVAADRIRTVSYGKEFPFDSRHTEEGWAQNRRGHFVITSR
jgi:peptidoglycan-associated lipoprotein